MAETDNKIFTLLLWTNHNNVSILDGGKIPDKYLKLNDQNVIFKMPWKTAKFDARILFVGTKDECKEEEKKWLNKRNTAYW